MPPLPVPPPLIAGGLAAVTDPVRTVPMGDGRGRLLQEEPDAITAAAAGDMSGLPPPPLPPPCGGGGVVRFARDAAIAAPPGPVMDGPVPVGPVMDGPLEMELRRLRGVWPKSGCRVNDAALPPPATDDRRSVTDRLEDPGTRMSGRWKELSTRARVEVSELPPPEGPWSPRGVGGRSRTLRMPPPLPALPGVMGGR
jgi:hypothetical protein